MQGLGHVSHSISHKVTNDLDTEKKVTSSINQSTKKSVEHSENDNVHASTDINSSDNIHRSSTTTDGPPNMQRMTSRRTSVCINMLCRSHTCKIYILVTICVAFLATNYGLFNYR